MMGLIHAVCDDDIFLWPIIDRLSQFDNKLFLVSLQAVPTISSKSINTLFRNFANRQTQTYGQMYAFINTFWATLYEYTTLQSPHHVSKGFWMLLKSLFLKCAILLRHKNCSKWRRFKCVYDKATPGIIDWTLDTCKINFFYLLSVCYFVIPYKNSQRDRLKSHGMFRRRVRGCGEIADHMCRAPTTDCNKFTETKGMSARTISYSDTNI